MCWTVLPERAVIAVTGSQDKAFLQSLLTADITALAAGEAVYAALLTPQGKILHDLFVVRVPEGYWLDYSAEQGAALAAKLNMYILRRDVDVNRRGDLAVAAGRRRAGVPVIRDNGVLFADPRTAEMGWRGIVPAGGMIAPGADAHAAYHARRVRLGLADSDAEIGSGRFFPHEANLDLLGAISFTKGCYVGQEVVSRIHHRGSQRARFLPFAAHGPAVAGQDVMAAGRRIGTILSANDENRGLALIRLDRVGEARQAKADLVTGEGICLDLIRPAWDGNR